MKKLNFLALLLASLVFYSCTSFEDEPKLKQNNSHNATLVEFAFDLANIQDNLVELDSLETIVVPINSKIMGENRAKTRSSVITPVQGTITNMGKQKTLWKYGVGENLVPRYLCGTNLGQMTISNVYKISISYDLTDDYTVKGFTGEKSGWNGQNINNPQTKFQGMNGDTSKITFFTFVYDILSTADGYTPPGGHLWVPFSQNEARIYVKIYD